MAACISVARPSNFQQLLSILHCGGICPSKSLLRHGRYGRGFSTKISDPLRILFCGSDEFSCASLRILDQERRQHPSLIESIDVVVRPAKRVGRGLKTVRKVPLHSLAEGLGLPIHVRDTFTGWSPPSPMNIIIAVSFGLFIPKRLLKAYKYGGLNVHPSMLPDLRGPAPIHHALLFDRTHTGVTLQTLDDTSFDHGVVLRQTPQPGFPIPNGSDVSSLLERLTPMGATMLLEGLRTGVHVPPLVDVSWTPPFRPAHAPKLGPIDRQMDWLSWTAEETIRRHGVLGPPWGIIVVEGKTPTRVILEDLEVVSLDREAENGLGSVGVVQWLPKRANGEGGDEHGHRITTTMKALPPPDHASGQRGITGWSDSVLIRLPNDAGAWLRVGKVKVEGKDFKPAKSVFRLFTHWESPAGECEES